jgi:hypothetical protein
MAGPLFTNNATGVLAAAYSAAATALTLTAGQGARFPSPGPDEWFPITIVDALNTIEIAHCTSRTGDTMTVTRGAEGTDARPLGAGEKVEHRLTAGGLVAIRDRPLDPSQISDGSITTAKLAPNAVNSDKIAPNSIYGTMVTPGAIDAGKMSPNAALVNLGYTPVQQGGGAGQGPGKIYLGFQGPFPTIQVDATHFGNILTEKNNGDPGWGGYRGWPVTDANSDYVLGLGDPGRAIFHSFGSHIYYLPSDSTPILRGNATQIVCISGNITLAADVGVTLVWVPAGIIGNRTITGPSICHVEKVAANTWYVYGNGIT